MVTLQPMGTASMSEQPIYIIRQVTDYSGTATISHWEIETNWYETVVKVEKEPDPPPLNLSSTTRGGKRFSQWSGVRINRFQAIK